MSRLGSIERYRERALDLAAIIAALATARVDEPSMLTDLAARQDAQLHDLVHEWAFHARKLFELVAREKYASAAYAKRPTVAIARENEEDPSDWPLDTLSLQDICGRIIHSDRFAIERARIPAQDGTLSRGTSPWGFRVASDRDPPSTALFVYVEFLLTEFMHFEEQLARDVRWAQIDE